MATDFGPPLEASCREVGDSGVFERQYTTHTVRLDCSKWRASFEPSPSASKPLGPPSVAAAAASGGHDGGGGGGYRGLGKRLPQSSSQYNSRNKIQAASRRP